jgi:hypothetical protein
MPSYTVVIVLAIAGALCLAFVAAGARRLPGGWRWTGLQSRGDDDKDRDDGKDRYVQQLVFREVLLDLLRARFGELPPAVVTRIESEDAEWCKNLFERAVTAESLEELGL